MNKIVYGLLGVAVICGVATGCAHGEQTDSTTDDGAPDFAFVTLAESAHLQQTLHLTGDVHLMEDRSMPVYAAGGGRIEEVCVAEGDYVRRGQTLATMCAAKSVALQRKLDDAQRSLDIATRQWVAVEKMAEGGLASQRELMEAERVKAEAKGKLEQLQLQAELSHLAQGGLRSIVTPIDGYVMSRRVNPGMTVADGNDEAMFTIANVDYVWADLCVYESDMTRVEEGSPVELQFIALPDTTIVGTIGRLSRMVDAESKVLVARVGLANHDHRLRPGMFVSGEVEVPDRGVGCCSVPSKAVVLDEGKHYVVLRCGDSLTVKQVEVLCRDGEHCFIATSLPEGCEVATRHSLLLYQQLQ